MDVNASNLINFLSNLESEKINNDLQLSEYEKKQQEMSKEYKAKGYFDQTYLAPNSTDQSSPFASLLTTLSNLEVKRIELLQKETESHPDVVNIDNQIAQIRKQLSSYNQNTLTAYQIIISTLKEKKAKLENLISQYKSQIHGMPGKQTELTGLTRDKDVYEKVFNLLLDKREEMRIKEVSQLQDIIIADTANLPVAPVSSKKIVILLVCLFLWSGLVISFVFVGEFHERKLLKLNEIEDNLQIPIFSIIPEFPKKLKKRIKKAKQLGDKLVSLSQEHPGIIESYNVLRTKLIFSLKNDTKIIMFTSCEENSGKTTTVANLGLSLAASDKKVLIIDADLKRCGLTDLIGISRDVPGLTTILSEDLRKLPIVDITKGYPKFSKTGSLSILPSGDISEHSSDLFQSAKATVLINALKSSFYDYILIDTPPVTRVIDALILGRIIGNAVMIVRDKKTLRESVDWGIKELRNEKVDIFGIVVNACEIEKTSYKQRYGYGYGYKYSYKKNEKGKVIKEKSKAY
jgi:capsular exopolysaccharide synthesis family protein